MFMNEKQINFDVHVVNLPGRETQSPWYLKINPKGEVPALKHGDRIISGSDNILEYIEKQKLVAIIHLKSIKSVKRGKAMST